MYLIVFGQESVEQVVGIVQNEADAHELIEAIPNIQVVTWEDEKFYEIQPEDLKDYDEIHFNGWRIPLTRLAFSLEDPVDVFIIKATDFTAPGNNDIAPGMTKVDAYLVPNDEVEEYINDRIALRDDLIAHYEKQGFTVDTRYQGSQDGEVVAYSEADELLGLIDLSPENVLAYKDLGFEEFITALEDDFEDEDEDWE